MCTRRIAADACQSSYHHFENVPSYRPRDYGGEAHLFFSFFRPTFPDSQLHTVVEPKNRSLLQNNSQREDATPSIPFTFCGRTIAVESSAASGRRKFFVDPVAVAWVASSCILLGTTSLCAVGCIVFVVN